MVGTGHVVAQRHRGVRAAEDGTGVLDALDDSIGILGLNLKVFGGVGVGRVDGLVKTVGQHDGRLGAGQRRVDALGVLGTRHAVLEVLLHLVGNLGGVGEQHGTGELIMLGLADEVGGQQARVGGFIGDDADFSGAGDRVDAHECGDQ